MPPTPEEIQAARDVLAAAEAAEAETPNETQVAIAQAEAEVDELAPGAPAEPADIEAARHALPVPPEAPPATTDGPESPGGAPEPADVPPGAPASVSDIEAARNAPPAPR